MIDIQKLRALLDAADMQLPLEVVPDLRPNLRSASNTGGFLGCGHIATMSRYDRSEDDAALIAGAVNALPEMLDEGERLRARKAEMCDCVHATGVIGETLAYIKADCPKCGGSGGVVVEATP